LLDDEKEFTYSVQNDQGQKLNLSLNLAGFTIDDIAEGHFFDKLGLHPFRSPWPAIIGDVMPGSVAERARLQPGDKILTLDKFLSFLGLVSVSLAIINLLPIPLLDGGHLFFYLIEWIKGSPITERTEYFFQQIGLTLLLGLMGLAIFNDLWRLFN